MPLCYAWLTLLNHSEPLRLGSMSTLTDLDLLRVAYARATVASVRLTGHAVNVGDTDLNISDFLLARAEDCSVSAVRIARALIESGSYAPASFHELELVSGIPDAIAGSDLGLIVEDANRLLALVEDSLDEIGMVEDAA